MLTLDNSCSTFRARPLLSFPYLSKNSKNYQKSVWVSAGFGEWLLNTKTLIFHPLFCQKMSENPKNFLEQQKSTLSVSGCTSIQELIEIHNTPFFIIFLNASPRDGCLKIRFELLFWSVNFFTIPYISLLFYWNSPVLQYGFPCFDHPFTIIF